jgi:hypothetical protein
LEKNVCFQTVLEKYPPPLPRPGVGVGEGIFLKMFGNNSFLFLYVEAVFQNGQFSVFVSKEPAFR